MKTPILKINGKIYKPKKRMKLLRKFFKLHESDIEFESEEGLEQIIDFVVCCFNDPDITAETIEEHVDFDAVFVLFRDIGEWVQHELQKEVGELPNEEAAERN